MQPGLRLALQGIDEEGDPVKEFTALMSSDQAPAKWERKADGFIESKAIAIGHYQTMLVNPKPDGKTCFSECLIFQFTEADLSKGVVVENIEVLPGNSTEWEARRKRPPSRQERLGNGLCCTASH